MRPWRIRAVTLVAAVVAATGCQGPPPVVLRTAPASRPDLLAGCYALRYGGPTYRSVSWPDDWRTRFIAPDRFAIGPLLPPPGHHTLRVVVIPLSWEGPRRPRIIAHVTADADSILIGSGVHGDGVTFRLALEGDTLPGVAALSGGSDGLKPVETVRRVMAVRVHCRTGEPLALNRATTRR
ncbi:MAG: hypothetical protein P8099_04095 [Gemmatimonadota bacterium]